jgi:D-sedoheptulose 7-phosphate isomerase
MEMNMQDQLTDLINRYPALAICKDDILKCFYILRECFVNNNKLMICGNGGSSADAGHIVGELMKGFLLPRKPDLSAGAVEKRLQKALPAIDLTQNKTLISAICNDIDPTLIYAQQVYGYGKSGDVLLGISTSGNAENVFEAAKLAHEMNIKVISLTGASGGRLLEVSDAIIRVPADLTHEVQELHLPVYHCLCAMLEEEFFGDCKG